MPCPVTSDVELIIQCDRKMIRTYIVFYAVIAAATIASAFYLQARPMNDGLLSKLIEPAITSVAIPVALLHLKRKNSLTPLLVMQSRGQRYVAGDPACDELKAWVDKELQRRMGEGNAAS